MNTGHCNQEDIAKNQEHIFIHTTITGNLQLIHLEHIVYFSYNSRNKLWEAVLYDGRTLGLRRNTNSLKILSLHSNLVQISQSHIINIRYLSSIESNNCILLPPFDEKEPLQVSKSFMKKLKEKFPCI
ncbi:LytTR family DNA-binding domain-containing protein [uncultured Bacteroides sp.]|uniref:LytTR family DNA-binding domain-containing protein n=1 Tax=uncultured Bacteroides sp. TaxID=162156 RepID=UPI002676005E|nr:LytTR family DNA-binding domain-containing protein [uncultured Bacteroides sp.]